jgi:hypothetical protein
MILKGSVVWRTPMNPCRVDSIWILELGGQDSEKFLN